MRRVAVLLFVSWALVTAVHAGPAMATFPGRNGLIAFDGYGDEDSDIFTVRADGSGLRRLRDRSGNESDPAWSADGARVVFSAAGALGQDDLFVMNADGTGVTRVTQGDDVDFSPSWSPDGTQIAFSRLGIGADVCVVNVDGTGLRCLAPGYSAKWSPDGTQIAFYSGSYDIFVMDSDGTNVRQLTHHPDSDFSPDWSPDGAQLIFTSNRNNFSPSYFSVFVMNADGSAETRLTEKGTFDTSPVWSPDGTKIAFGRDDDGIDLYVLRSDGTGVRRITFLPFFANSPDWQALPT